MINTAKTMYAHEREANGMSPVAETHTSPNSEALQRAYRDGVKMAKRKRKMDESAMGLGGMGVSALTGGIMGLVEGQNPYESALKSGVGGIFHEGADVADKGLQEIAKHSKGFDRFYNKNKGVQLGKAVGGRLLAPIGTMGLAAAAGAGGWTLPALGLAAGGNLAIKKGRHSLMSHRYKKSKKRFEKSYKAIQKPAAPITKQKAVAVVGDAKQRHFY